MDFDVATFAATHPCFSFDIRVHKVAAGRQDRSGREYEASSPGHSLLMSGDVASTHFGLLAGQGARRRTLRVAFEQLTSRWGG